MRVFGQKEQAPLHRAVFGVPAADQFLFAFGQVERQPLGFGHRSDEEDQAGQRLNPDVPADQTLAGLVRQNLLDAHRTVQQRQTDDRHPQRNLVTDHLGTGPQATERAVLVVRRPATQDDPVHRQAADREDEHDAEVDARRDDERELAVARCQMIRHGTKRHDAKREERREDRDPRCQHEQHLVHVTRNHVFLQQQFEHIRHGLKQPERPDAVGAMPVLHPGRKLPLQQDQVRAHAQVDVQHDDDYQERHRIRPSRLGQHADEPLPLAADKIQEILHVSFDLFDSGRAASPVIGAA